LVPSLASDRLRRLAIHFGPTAWLMAGTVVSGIVSYGSVALNARLLGTDGFGLMAALLGIGSLGAVLLRPASFAATHLAIGAQSRSAPDAMRALLGFSVAVGAALTLVLFVILLALAIPLNNLLKTNGLFPIGFVAPLLAATASLQLISGLFAGAHRFGWLATATVIEAAVRALVTAPFVILWGVSGAIAAYVAGQIASVAFSVLRAGGLVWHPPPMEHLLDGLRTGLSAISLVAGIALLQNGDLILLRWYAQPLDVGLYAACSSLGNLFITLSAPVYLPAFPRALAAHRQGKPTLPVLLMGVAPILAAGVAATVASIWLAGPIARMLFGQAFEGVAPVMPIYFARTSALVLVGVVGQHAMAIGRGNVVHVGVPVAVGGLAVIALLRPDSQGTALVGLVSGVVLIAWLGGMALARPSHKADV
jgi:O-antigen/teichoic acid export membrane protein